jgi:hypothetical protein
MPFALWASGWSLTIEYEKLRGTLEKVPYAGQANSAAFGQVSDSLRGNSRRGKNGAGKRDRYTPGQ